MNKQSLLPLLFCGLISVTGWLAPPLAQAKATPFKVTVSGQPDHAAYLAKMIIENGWDKAEGFELKLVYFDSGMAQIEALPAKQWVAGTMTAVPWLVGAVRHNLYAVALANDDTTSNLVLVRPDSPILKEKGTNPDYPETYGSMAGVRGKTILTTTVSSAHYALSTWLKRLGLDDKDVVIKNMDQAQALAAFEAGIGDAVVLWAPTMFVGMDKGWKCVNIDSQRGASTPSVIAAAKDWADANPDQVVKVLRAYFKAIDKMNSDNIALAESFSTWLRDWAGIEMAPRYAAIDIQNHKVWSLEEQLALFDESKGQSSVEQWVQLLGNFFVQQGRFKPTELKPESISNTVTDRFLKLLASEKS